MCATSNYKRGQNIFVCLKVVPVKVWGPGSERVLTTYAFLDEGSTST